MANKHILFIITSCNVIGTSKVETGYEFSEVADPYFEFTNNNFIVDFASIKGGETPEDGYDEDYLNNKLFKNSAGFKRMNFSHKLENVNLDAYDAIFFPGGLGPMVDMFHNPSLKKIIAEFYESGKIISAVCHGSVAFLNVVLSNKNKLLEGKKITSFTKAEEDLKKHHLNKIIPFFLEGEIKNEGAVFSCKEPFKSYVLVDGNIITGQNPASASSVAKEIIKNLTKY
jgi:putative intracellular protease/amidase